MLAMGGAVVVLASENIALNGRIRECYSGEASLQSLEKAVFSLTWRT